LPNIALPQPEFGKRFGIAATIALQPPSTAAFVCTYTFQEPKQQKEKTFMPSITTTDGTEIYYKDWGSGQPLFFHHGWPLSADDWDTQMMFFLSHGFRVIAHDRRGHGRSTQTAIGHDMDTYAADVAAVVKTLDLKNAIHIGHSTGGWRGDPLCRTAR
jgi:alpha-beta hydrolase superfamily lysophospholipase